ncbi:MAG: hypothetical protein R3B82_02280 [Sandaracinaceae bacterium]
MKVTLVLFPVLALAFAAGCANPVLGSSADANARAIEIVGSGEAISAEQIVDDGFDVYEVMVRMANGAELEVLMFVDTGELYEVKDFTGPFDYDMTPVAGSDSYSTARGRVLEGTPGTVEGWEIKLLPAEDRYFYEFYVRDDGGQLYEIKHYADTGEMISYEAVATMD